MTVLDRSSISPLQMAAAAADAAALMKALSNERRLLILCHLVAEDEMPVGELVSKIGISQSALSQHLAKLRDEGLVGFRRQSQTLFYRVADERAGQVLELLHDIFCLDLGGARKSGDSRMSATAAARDNRRKGK